MEVAGIALVKPEKAAMIENAIMGDAQMGKMTGKLTAQQLIQKIEELDASEAKTTLKVRSFRLFTIVDFAQVQGSRR